MGQHAYNLCAELTTNAALPPLVLATYLVLHRLEHGLVVSVFELPQVRIAQFHAQPPLDGCSIATLSRSLRDAIQSALLGGHLLTDVRRGFSAHAFECRRGIQPPSFPLPLARLVGNIVLTRSFGCEQQFGRVWRLETC